MVCTSARVFLKRNKHSLRRTRINTALIILVSLIFVSLSSVVTGQEKRPLSIEDFAQWKSISSQRLSEDGKWLAYVVSPQYGNGELIVRNLSDDTDKSVARGSRPAFAAGNSKLVFMITPPKDEKNKEDNNIKSKLGILTLVTGDIEEIERVSGFNVSDDGSWAAYKMFAPDKKDEETEAGKTGGKKKNTGTKVVLLNLNNGAEKHFEEVTSYSFDKNSRFLIYSVVSADDTQDGFSAIELESGRDYLLLAGVGKYQNFTWDENAGNLAFVSDRDNPESKTTAWKIYRWRPGESSAEAIVDTSVLGSLPGKMMISANPGLRWSKNSRSLFFNISEIPEPADTTVKNEDLPDLDVWHWKDVLIQTQQLNRLSQLRNVSYLTVFHIDREQAIRLADGEVSSVTPAPNDILALGTDAREYEFNQPWNPTWQDVYLVNCSDGTKTLLKKKMRPRIRWSNEGKYLYWFEDKDWYVYSIATGETRNITEGLDVELRNILNDRPTVLGAWGSVEWTKDDEGVLVYDQYDIWYVPVNGGEPDNITGGEGRRRNATFRYVSLDPDEEFIDLDKTMLLSFLNNRTKAQGYYTLRNGSRNPVKLIELPKKIGRPVKSKYAGLLLFTLETFEEFPDLNVSDMDFKNIKKVSNANPRQEEFLWGKEELIEWRSIDGKPLQGVLYYPANYESGKKYPLILYIYEMMSQRLHSYSPPIANHRFNATEYTSNGYAVLYPDIVYDKGLPGPSSVKCLVPAVQKVVDMGIADPERVGLQGHSWGGYESAYIITQTNIFSAVCSGAPVSNMTSAYGGIRWGSGNPRTFQYETGQSRIGGSLWEYPELYIENSPIFFADRVQTPILILHGDEDDAVPWYQAIEYFLALRRLNKPVWFLQYNNEPHHLRKKKNMYDFTVRMQQFFDHYLMDKPMPEWMDKGVPATRKGKR